MTTAGCHCPVEMLDASMRPGHAAGSSTRAMNEHNRSVPLRALRCGGITEQAGATRKPCHDGDMDPCAGPTELAGSTSSSIALEAASRRLHEQRHRQLLGDLRMRRLQPTTPTQSSLCTHSTRKRQCMALRFTQSRATLPTNRRHRAAAG